MVVLLFITCWIRGSGRIAGVECDDEYRASIEKHLNVVFVPDYNVSVAELLIPRGELSQHMSSYPFPFQFEDSNEVLIPRGGGQHRGCFAAAFSKQGMFFWQIQPRKAGLFPS
ncbi:unnamed protein product [Lactuca virosa]|uniref:Uncharacterized protein n=1 Tax=Lactuca virosa TaxID=75947 RepID=A0AAU9MJA5_9ASTR|nr:unnamed protein product [Lactuca virosa]